MRVAITTEHHFDRTPDGAIWTKSMFTNEYWTQYLDAFEHVCVVARVRDVLSAAADWQRVDSDEVSFVPVPDYLGPWEYLRKARQVHHAVQQGLAATEAAILYNGQLAVCAEAYLRRVGRPYGMYVISDPDDVFAPGAARYPLRAFFRWRGVRQVRRQVKGACAVAYVSHERLQHKYQPRPGVFSTYFAMQGLGNEWYVSAPRTLRQDKRPVHIITVGSLAQLYKGPDVLIDAVAHCLKEGLKLKLTLIGDGKHRKELEERSRALGIHEHVSFLGQLPSGEAIRAELDKADLFVLASRAEALGLVIAEAMARGLPCIGTTVGGIPELLPPEDLVPPGDAKALAAKIREVIRDEWRTRMMAERNLAKAQEYDTASVGRRQKAFYLAVRAETERWLSEKQDQKRSLITHISPEQ